MLLFVVNNNGYYLGMVVSETIAVNNAGGFAATMRAVLAKRGRQSVIFGRVDTGTAAAGAVTAGAAAGGATAGSDVAAIEGDEGSDGSDGSEGGEDPCRARAARSAGASASEGSGSAPRVASLEVTREGRRRRSAVTR